MKIAIITSPFCELPPDAIGAVERRWFNTAEIFASLNHSVQLIGKKGPTVLQSSERLMRTYAKGFRRTGSIFGDIFLDAIYTVRALRFLNACDILVLNTFWGPILAPLVARKKYNKLVYNVARFPKKHIRLYQHVDLFVCTSSAVKHHLLKIAPSLSCRRVEVVNNPIDTSVFCRSSDYLRREEPLIGYHGRVNEEKGLDILARAVAKLGENYPGIRIKMIGPWTIGRGGSGEQYKRMLDKLSGGRIDWVGPIADREKLVEQLRECSVYCYPSVAEKGETFGVSPLEAMGLGLPVVVSALECFTDFIEDGKSGIIFNHRSPSVVEDLSGIIQGLLSDENRRSIIGRAAAERAKDFSTENIARDYLKLFES